MESETFNPFGLAGKQIVVTGASSGIGRAVAVACARMGATVYLTARNEQRLQETLDLMPKGNHVVIAADLTKEEQVGQLVAQLPMLDGIVHCAGIGNRTPCRMIGKDVIEEVFHPNFMAPVMLQSALLTEKKVAKSASVVFISSRAASYPSVGNAVYSASKGALNAYAKCLALEVASRKIRVNCICPGMVWTDLIVQSGIDRTELEQAQTRYPLKRFGTVDDVAYLVVYLLSDAASWMTGSCIDLSGGGEGILM